MSKRKKHMLLKMVFVSTAAILASGCAKPNVEIKSDPAMMALSEAAESIHADLTLLSRIRQEESGVHERVRAHKTPNRDSSLSKLVTLSWSGPLEPAVQIVAEKIGFNYKVIGNGPAQPILVNLNYKDKPAFELLEDMGWQAGENVGVVLNQKVNELQVIYIGSTERIL